jgi:hypothetical protein
MSFASKVKGALPRVWAVLKDVHANLTPSQRRKVYGVATMAGVALAAKLGVEADTLFEWVAFAATIFSGVVAPAIARSKVDD